MSYWSVLHDLASAVRVATPSGLTYQFRVGLPDPPEHALSPAQKSTAAAPAAQATS